MCAPRDMRLHEHAHTCTSLKINASKAVARGTQTDIHTHTHRAAEKLRHTSQRDVSELFCAEERARAHADVSHKFLLNLACARNAHHMDEK